MSKSSDKRKEYLKGYITARAKNPHACDDMGSMIAWYDKKATVKGFPVAVLKGDVVELFLDLDVHYISNKLQNNMITVPAGFTSDLASIPAFLRPFFSKLGKYNTAALVHDYLYVQNELKFSRKECDLIFLDLMQRAGVGKVKSKLMYRAVRAFGGRYYNG